MSIEIDPVEWQMRVAVFQGRVERFNRNVTMGPAVEDVGIDLRRGRARGISGYEAERMRQEKFRTRSLELANSAVEAAAAEIKLPTFDCLKPSIKVIQVHTCYKAGVSVGDLVSARRTKKIVKPRQIAMMLSKILTPNSLPQIGRQFGNRDHTTVLHALRKLEPVEKFVVNSIRPDDDLPVWVNVAFEGWDALGL